MLVFYHRKDSIKMDVLLTRPTCFHLIARSACLLLYEPLTLQQQCFYNSVLQPPAILYCTRLKKRSQTDRKGLTRHSRSSPRSSEDGDGEFREVVYPVVNPAYAPYMGPYSPRYQCTIQQKLTLPLSRVFF